MKRLWQSNSSRPSSGFTIVELLIVIVVIGILAAIVIVAYNGVQNNANTAAVKSSLKTMFTRIQAYQADEGNGQYPTTAAQLENLNLKISSSSFMLSNNIFVFCYYTDHSAAAVLGRSKGDQNMYAYSSKAGLIQLPGVGSSTQERCNFALGETGTDFSGKASINGTVPGPPTSWATWVGAN
jgi:prepilin-type N-terminal cleavage/methylation domain-containing protein